jgi:hypothetical protein
MSYSACLIGQIVFCWSQLCVPWSPTPAVDGSEQTGCKATMAGHYACLLLRLLGGARLPFLREVACVTVDWCPEHLIHQPMVGNGGRACMHGESNPDMRQVPPATVPSTKAAMGVTDARQRSPLPGLTTTAILDGEGDCEGEAPLPGCAAKRPR